MAVTLESLPTELLDNIIGFAGPPASASPGEAYHRRIRTYTSVCRTSRALRAVGQSHLYAFMSTSDLGANIQPLLQTLRKRPALASLVKEIYIEPGCDAPNPMARDELDLCWKAIDEALGTNQLSYEARKAFNRRKGCRAWEAVMLLALSTKIRKLSICEFVPGLTVCVHCPMIGKITRILFQLRSPRDCSEFLYSTLADARMGCITHTSFSALMQLPALQKLTSEMSLQSHVSGDEGWLCTRGKSNVSDLDMQMVHLDANALSRVIASCKSLDRLRVEFAGVETGGPIDVSTLHATLRLHESSLTKLVLESKTQEYLVSRKDRSCALDLGTFSRLETLHIDEELLLGKYYWLSDELDAKITLPASLVDLCIFNHRDMISLPIVIEAVQASLPDNLQHLRILFEPDTNGSLSCRKQISRKSRHRRTPAALQWWSFSFGRPGGRLFSGFTFHCWKKHQPLKTTMSDLPRLADNGNNTYAVLDYLYPGSLYSQCICKRCIPWSISHTHAYRVTAPNHP